MLRSRAGTTKETSSTFKTNVQLGNAEDGKGGKGKVKKSTNLSQLLKLVVGLAILASVNILFRGGKKTTPHSSPQVVSILDFDNKAPNIPSESIYSLTVKDIHGKDTPLAQYNGFVSLVVNVASEWGKTDITYEQLSTLQHKYGGEGFIVLAFPSNDFRQETGTNEEIEAFVNSHFPNCGFPLFAKSRLHENKVYQYLSEHDKVQGKQVKGNFNKYLVDRKGMAVSLHGKKEECFSFENEIVELLKS